MKFEKFMRLLFIATLGFMVMLVVTERSEAGGVDVTSESTSGSTSTANTNVTGGDVVGGDVSTGGNKTFAFAYGMGDVDINEGKNCMGSEQWGTVIVGRQTMELNPWCAALFYELNGKHTFAAKMRCDIKEIRRKYKTAEECWADQDLTPAEAEPTVLEEHHEIEEQHNEDLQLVQNQIAEVMQELEAVKNKPRPRVVQQAPQQQYTDEQIEAVWKALKGDEDE